MWPLRARALRRGEIAHARPRLPPRHLGLQVRRAMEAENDKARRAAKREFNEAVRELAGFLRKRDKRAIAHQVGTARRHVAWACMCVCVL